MGWKIISLIFTLVVLSVPTAAEVVKEISIQDGKVSKEVVTEVTVNKGDIYTVALGKSVPACEMKIVYSSGLKLLPSSTPEVKQFLAVSRGKQTITTECRGTSAIKIITTIVNVI